MSINDSEKSGIFIRETLDFFWLFLIEFKRDRRKTKNQNASIIEVTGVDIDRFGVAIYVGRQKGRHIFFLL